MDADTAAAYEQFVMESRARLSNNASQHRYNGAWSCQQ